MPSLPWTTTTADVDPRHRGDGDGSRLPLRSHRSIPSFLRWTLRIRRQLASSPGLVGYALDAHLLREEFWTVSAWAGRPDLRRFDRADPHAAAVADIRPAMAPTTFVTWTAMATDLPIGWDEVRRRVDEVRTRREGGEGGDASAEWLRRSPPTARRGEMVPMPTSPAVEEHLAALPDDRRAAIEAVRSTVLEHLPEGFEEGIEFGMISWHVPLSRYPDTYNGRPLGLAALASQKRHMALYLTGVYGDPAAAERFAERWRATGKRLDMGKSCVRFRRLDDVPLDVVGDAVAATSVDKLIDLYERSRTR